MHIVTVPVEVTLIVSQDKPLTVPELLDNVTGGLRRRSTITNVATVGRITVLADKSKVIGLEPKAS